MSGCRETCGALWSGTADRRPRARRLVQAPARSEPCGYPRATALAHALAGCHRLRRSLLRFHIRLHLDGCGGTRLRLRSLAAGLVLHVDAATEVRAFSNGHARSGDVAVNRAVFADVDFFGGADVADHLAEDHDRLRVNLRLDLAVGTDRQYVIAKIDSPFDVSLDREILAAVQLALDDD